MNDYQKQILDRVKGRINQWLESLKQKNPELLLTRQWRIVWLKGFVQGQNTMPVITSCKDGEYQIGEIQIVLPPSLELDLEAVELVLLEQPYVASGAAPSIPSLNDPLDLLNDLVLGISGFLSGMPMQPNSMSAPVTQSLITPLKVNPLGGPSTALPGDLNSIQAEILKSPYLPDWYKAIKNSKVAQGMLNKLVEGYAQYNLRKGYTGPLKEYFEQYTEALLKQNKLHQHCPYKGRGVEMDFQGHCKEAFCSKKPHNAPCPVPHLRLGALEPS